MISIARTLIHPGRASAPSTSPATILMRRMRNTSASVESSAENCLRRRKTTRVPRRVSGKVERSESVLRRRGERWCRRRSRSSECCACKDIGTCKGDRNVAHLVKQIMIIREHALDKLKSESLVEVLQL